MFTVGCGPTLAMEEPAQRQRRFRTLDRGTWTLSRSSDVGILEARWHICRRHAVYTAMMSLGSTFGALVSRRALWRA